MKQQQKLLYTRAELIGVKPKVLAARTRRSLSGVRARVERLAKPWADVDNSVDGAVRDILETLDGMETALREAVEYLNEIPT